MPQYSSSVTDGPGVVIPDQPSSGGAPLDTAAMIQMQNAGATQQRDAIAQAMMAQQAQAAQQVNPWAQMFGAHSAPSGSPTDVGWMNALQPNQGGVTVGGQPGTPPSGGAAFTGGGSMRTPNANYWMGGRGGGLTPKVPGYDDSWLYGGGPGNSAGDPGASNQGTPGYSGFADRGVFGPENEKGFPTDYLNPPPNSPRGDPNAPQGLTGFEAYSRAQQDYSPVNDPYNFDFNDSRQAVMQQSMQQAEAMNAVQQAIANAIQDAQQDDEEDAPQGTTAAPAGGWGGYGGL